MVLLHDHLFPVIPPSIAKQYQTRFERALLEVSEQDLQWLAQIDIDLPIAHSAPHLECIKQAMASSNTIRLTLIGQCLHIKPERLRLASDGVFVGYLHPRHQLQFISLTHVLDAH
ncbi:hypothetical protein [Vibrio parahaemolyticus]|uniref:hypothetical protein n=1 Tax=Vibrio parahaemolyticus TaxID=670 RepID=UPI0004DFBD8F|nr:hypothetical protein [Vibrio parahaemolyticus]